MNPIDVLAEAYDKQFPWATPFEQGCVLYEYRKTLDALEDCGLEVVAKPARPLTVDQARTQDLERRGLHGAVVRTDGLAKAVVEVRFEDLDRLLGLVSPVQAHTDRLWGQH